MPCDPWRPQEPARRRVATRHDSLKPAILRRCNWHLIICRRGHTRAPDRRPILDMSIVSIDIMSVSFTKHLRPTIRHRAGALADGNAVLAGIADVQGVLLRHVGGDWDAPVLSTVIRECLQSAFP